MQFRITSNSMTIVTFYCVILFIIPTDGVNTARRIENTELEWGPASSLCRKKGGKLLSFDGDVTSIGSQDSKPETKYWVSRYVVSVSVWIRIIGCYWNNMNDFNKTDIPGLSAALCQEYCGTFPYFGMRNDTCYCIRKLVVLADFTGEQKCKWNCTGDPMDRCGGQIAVSVYGKETREIRNNKCGSPCCLALQCEGNSMAFIEKNCNEANAGLCRNDETYKEDAGVRYLSWRKMVQKCGSNGLSLGTNESVCNGDITCPRWIGVVKRTFERNESVSFQGAPSAGNLERCWYCHIKDEQLDQCSSGDCNETLGVICEFETDNEASSVAQVYTSYTDNPEIYTTDETTMGETVNEAKIDGVLDQSTEEETQVNIVGIVSGAASSAIVVVLVTIFVICWKKRGNRSSNDDLIEKQAGDNTAENGENDSQDHNYHIVEPYEEVGKEFPVFKPAHHTFHNKVYIVNSPDNIIGRTSGGPTSRTLPVDGSGDVYRPPEDGEYDELGKCEQRQACQSDQPEAQYSSVAENDYAVSITDKLDPPGDYTYVFPEDNTNTKVGDSSTGANTSRVDDSDYWYRPPEEGEYDELGKCMQRQAPQSDQAEAQYRGMSDSDYATSMTAGRIELP